MHSSRVRSAEDRELIRQLTPHMDQLIAVSQSIARKIADEHRIGAPVQLIYNGVDLQRFDQQTAAPLREEYGHGAGLARSSASSPGSSRRRATRR